MTTSDHSTLASLLSARFGDLEPGIGHVEGGEALATMAGRGSCRSFTRDAVPSDVLKTLSAVALASPTKSDLQQRDIVIVQSEQKRHRLAHLVSGQAWVADAPNLVIFCGNNRRQRQLHDWHEVPFANDHLDAFFNAAVDAGIALGAFVTAAEAIGLGCCPISAVRNEAAAVSDLLGLPDHVFPVAGLAVGYPAQPSAVSMRLPLSATLHEDTFSETGLQQIIQHYDAERATQQPYATQRFTARFGTSDTYGWSEDKTRQYAFPEREDFGAFVRSKLFNLD